MKLSSAFPKVQSKIIQAHASTQGESTNAFIFRAIQEQIKRDEGVALIEKA